jgi:uncharacterized heparinase superfamily protein
MADSLRMTRLLAGKGLRSVRGAVSRVLAPIGGLVARTPERLLIAPPDLRTADPTIASDIYAGFFAFAGKVAQTGGASPFSIQPPSQAWADALNGFGWLRHLRAAESALARENARILVSDFLRVSGRPVGPAWRLPIASRRLISWLAHSPLLLEGADHAFYRRFVRAVARQARQISVLLEEGEDGEQRLRGAIALCMAGLAADGLGGLLRRGGRVLSSELRRQILADGCHVSRSPQALVDLLYDLLPLRQTFVARGMQPPEALIGAIDRTLPFLRMLRLGDGSLALFNGMSFLPADALPTLFAYDDQRAEAPTSAPHGGYQRLVHGQTVMIVDAGTPPPLPFSGQAHAGCLAFEWSSGTRRIVVSCGAAPYGNDAVRDAARSTAAHSTLTVDDTSSCRFLDTPRFRSWLGVPIASGPKRVEVARNAFEDRVEIVASHDGYAERFGLIHRRRLAVARDGALIEGVDQLCGIDGGQPGEDRRFALRFHLHPAIKASLVDDGRAALLVSPEGEVWRFQCGGLPVSVEESIYFANPDGGRRSEQIVVDSHTGLTSDVAWSFARETQPRPRAARRQTGEVDELPL